MNALRPSALLALLAAAACDPSSAAPPELGELAPRAYSLEIAVPDTAPVAHPSTLALSGDFEAERIVWAVVDHPPDPGVEEHPPDPGLVSCVAGFGADAIFSATQPGAYVVRALVLDPESLALRSWVDAELYVEGEDLSEELRPADVMFDILERFDADEASGIDPAPFHGALLFGEDMSLSAGCLLEG